MRKIKKFVLLLGLISVCSFSDAMTIEQYKVMRSANESAAISYIAGMTVGFFIRDGSSGDGKLICIPNKYIDDPDFHFKNFNEYLVEKDIKNEQTLEFVYVKALVDMYRCL